MTEEQDPITSNEDENAPEGDSEDENNNQDPGGESDPPSGDSGDDSGDDSDDEEEDGEEEEDDDEIQARGMDSDDDDDDPPEDEDEDEKITRIVQKQTRGIREQNQKLQDQIEVDSYLQGNSDMAKHRGKILKYMAHPAYKNVPVQNIAAIVGSKDMMKMGAKKEREAAEKAKKTRDPGSSKGKIKTGDPNWHTASDEDYQAKLKEVRGY